jgi:protein SCO1/2
VAQRPAVTRSGDEPAGFLDRAFWFVIVAAACLVVVMLAGVAFGGRPAGPGGEAGADASASSSPPIDVAAHLLPLAREAPPIELTDPNERPFSLASLRGSPTFVFFGYTHCPDVCPATIGTVGLAMEAFGPGARAVFVSVDPERDTTAWLREYTRYLPAGFTALTGTSDRIRSTADAWGVQYAKVETGVAGAYSMSHTADVFLVDGAGTIRASFPFGTSSEAMTAVLRAIVATTPAATPPTATSATPAVSPTPLPAATPTPAVTSGTAGLGVEVSSTAVWAGTPGPVILRLSVDGAPITDTTLRPTVQLISGDGQAAGEPVPAIAVRPPGVADVSFVATLRIPNAGPWRLDVTAPLASGVRSGTVGLDVLDQGSTAPLGMPAPTVRTPTLDDVGGVARAVTTDPAPDLRLSQTSAVDALAAHQPFVLVIDSSRFRVSPVCGRAIIMARYLLDRWRDVAFIHLEPYRYHVIEDTAVLDGSLDAPTLTDPTAAWGIGGAPWGARSMPWTFVIDGAGVVRAKYQGVTGTADVDVMLALIAAGG